MFVEGEVEITIRDRSVSEEDDYAVKLWIQRAFKDMSCYRIQKFNRESPKKIKAVVALKTDVLPESERKMIEGHGRDIGMLRSFMEKMFVGKGSCKSIGDPKLREN